MSYPEKVLEAEDKPLEDRSRLKSEGAPILKINKDEYVKLVQDFALEHSILYSELIVYGTGSLMFLGIADEAPAVILIVPPHVFHRFKDMSDTPVMFRGQPTILKYNHQILLSSGHNLVPTVEGGTSIDEATGIHYQNERQVIKNFLYLNLRSKAAKMDQVFDLFLEKEKNNWHLMKDSVKGLAAEVKKNL